MSGLRIRPFETSDEDATIELWRRSGLLRPWNDPRKDIARKLRIQADLFLIATDGPVVVGTVMAGYDGHRGWINYLAVDPKHRRQGIGRELVLAAERKLRALGCPKINLQLRRENGEARAFYVRLGFVEDDSVSFGKRLEHDGPARK
jgi:ribosomal protein S18 acetylase RimI-like enzyme